MFFFFFNDTATTEIYTLSLHDALPIYDQWDTPRGGERLALRPGFDGVVEDAEVEVEPRRRVPLESRTSQSADRKSTRLNSSHSQISYAVFCLKKKKKRIKHEMNLTDR